MSQGQENRILQRRKSKKLRHLVVLQPGLLTSAVNGEAVIAHSLILTPNSNQTRVRNVIFEGEIPQIFCHTVDEWLAQSLHTKKVPEFKSQVGPGNFLCGVFQLFHPCYGLF